MLESQVVDPLISIPVAFLFPPLFLELIRAVSAFLDGLHQFTFVIHLVTHAITSINR